MREFDLVDILRARLQPRRADTRYGIGDDAAILTPPAGCELIVTTDTLIAGRHFPADTAPEDIGYKAIAVNLSDIAAMGAAPAWLTVSLASAELSEAWCRAFVDGMQAACAACPTAWPIDIVGGDTTRAERLHLSITAIGHVAAGQAVRRDGARVGDAIAVTGTLGDAAAGLALRQRVDSPDAAWLAGRLDRPDLRRGTALASQAHAAIDVSDGLLADLGHILSDSGVGAELQIDALPCSPALARAVPDRDRRRQHQATGGDDYELCLTAAPADIEALHEALGCPLTVIGTVTADTALRLIDEAGHTVAAETLGAAGWDHFESP